MSSEQESPLEEKIYRFRNGELCARGFFRNGKREGILKIWHENGQLREHCFYQDGKLEGKLKTWLENGNVREMEFCENGKSSGEYRRWCNNGAFHVNSHIYFFPWKKRDEYANIGYGRKLTILKMRRQIRERYSFSAIDDHIIPDLAKICF
jgi:hypothetical protein